jgi:hypothetical protein
VVLELWQTQEEGLDQNIDWIQRMFVAVIFCLVRWFQEKGLYICQEFLMVGLHMHPVCICINFSFLEYSIFILISVYIANMNFQEGTRDSIIELCCECIRNISRVYYNIPFLL